MFRRLVLIFVLAAALPACSVLDSILKPPVVVQPPPAPPPVIVPVDPPIPPPPPPPPPLGEREDAVPAGEVIWHDADPSGYPITVRLSEVTIAGGPTGPVVVCWRMPPPGWRDNGMAKPINGNVWIGARLADGKVHMGTWEFYAPRFTERQCRTTEARAGEPPFIQSHGLDKWVPQHGERVFHMISTIARGGAPPNLPHERSNIFETVWP